MQKKNESDELELEGDNFMSRFEFSFNLMDLALAIKVNDKIFFVNFHS